MIRMNSQWSVGHQNVVAFVETCCWPTCEQPRHHESDAPPMCTNHLIKCAHYIADRMSLNLLDPGNAAREREYVEAQHLTHCDTDSVVYYVRLVDHVKIGTSTNLSLRLESFYAQPSSVLATEPGGRDLEQFRHGQFAAERVYANRELFNPSPRLLTHIASLTEDALSA